MGSQYLLVFLLACIFISIPGWMQRFIAYFSRASTVASTCEMSGVV